MKTVFFNNMNMRKKMLFIYLIAILIPFIVGGLFYTQYANNLIKRQALEMTRSRTLVYSQNLNSRLDSYVTLANMIANNGALMKKIDDVYSNILDAYSLYQEIWTQHAVNVQTWPSLRNITIYSSNTSLRNSVPYFIRFDSYMANLPEYNEILGQGIFGMWYGVRNVSSAEYWNSSNKDRLPSRYRTFTYNRMLYSTENILIPTGIITIEIFEKSLMDIIKTEDELNIVVLDHKNNPVVQTSENMSNMYPLALEIESNAAPVLIQDKNISYYADSNRLDNGWRIVVVMPLENVLANARAFQNYGLLLLLFMSCINIFLVFLFSKLIAKRSRTLLTKMETFMGGEMILGDPIGGHDEIGLLDERFTALAKDLKQRIDETYILQLQKNRFRLQTLQAQINPHFLYNTLSTIAWLSDSGPRSKIREAVESLASFYRVTLSKGRDVIPLSEELKGLGDYIQLQKLRYVGRITVYYNIDSYVSEINIPKLTLQPLVENSICHGLSGERDSVSIMISAQCIHNIVEIIIQDDGVGMDSEVLQKLLTGEIKSGKKGGMGLKNINERIKLYFGSEYGISAKSEEGQGTVVKISIPFDTVSL